MGRHCGCMRRRAVAIMSRGFFAFSDNVHLVVKCDAQCTEISGFEDTVYLSNKIKTFWT